MALIGIDLGTTNSLASIYRGGKVELIPTPLGTFLTPSVVSVEDDGSICVGDIAKERLVSHPHRTAASFKRMMGTDQTMILAGKPFTAQELSSFVLRQLKADAQRYLGEEVVEAVISVPAYFDDYQRSATKEAGLLAGLRVERLINEPSAAALAGRGSDEEDRSYLVFDLGGGTLDVSIVDCFENVVEIVAVSGDNQLGGNDFDLLIAQYLCAKHCLDYNALSDKSRAVLLRVAEKCKQELTNNKAAVQRMLIEEREYEVFLTNPELVKISYGLFEKISAVTSRALKDSRKTIEEIDEVILVGGSSKMPVIAYYLETHLGKAPVYLGSPDEMVALGAGIFAGIKERNREIKDLVLTDICPFTLGINVVNHSDVTRPVLSPIIERNSILPTSKRSFFTNASDNQEQVRIGIYQGEAYHCDENLFLGEILMEIRRMPKGRVLLEVCFSYDINGILEVDVLDHQKNERKQKVLTSHRLKWTEEEIAARLKDLHTYKMRPPGGERVRLILARGERLFAERTGEERAMVAAMLDSLQQSLYAANDQEALKRSRSADELFASLDG